MLTKGNILGKYWFYAKKNNAAKSEVVVSYDGAEISMDEYARQTAIDFFNWQKKDYAECCADMSVGEWFDKYSKYTK